ncbi:GNAT family N-acetyltransferase [Mycoplasmatota bacterium WC30]
MKTLITERLILRPFVLEDVDDFYDYCKLDTVGPNAGWAVHTDKEISLKIIKGFIEKGDVLAIFHKEDKKVIGSVGLHKKMDIEGNIMYEIGYVLSTPYEGKGYMTETVKRVLKYGFLELDIAEIFVCHFIQNIKSKRVIQKCNFIYQKDIEYQTANYGLKQSRFYSLKKEEYIKKMEETK